MTEDIDLRATKTVAATDKGQARARTLRIRKLQHYFGQGEVRKQVLFDNNLDIYEGEIVIVTGPSGSGKTTLLTLIGTLRTVQEGSLRVLWRELAKASPAELVAARRDIGFIFQAHNLFGSLTAMQNVRMALELFNIPEPEMNQRAAYLLNRLGLGHRLHYKPESLSGGQKQRVAIARGLAHNPKIVLADEPTAALDEASGREVVTLFQELAKEQKTTILMVTHDSRILDVADRIVNMVDGHIRSDVVVGESVLICEFIKKTQTFRELDAVTLTTVADKMWAEQHLPGDVVVRQGEPGDKFYLIRSGEVAVIKDLGQGPRTVAVLGEGDCFGERALLTNEPRNATIRTLKKSLLYVLGKADFQTALDASANFREQLQKALFERH